MSKITYIKDHYNYGISKGWEERFCLTNSMKGFNRNTKESALSRERQDSLRVYTLTLKLSGVGLNPNLVLKYHRDKRGEVSMCLRPTNGH